MSPTFLLLLVLSASPGGSQGAPGCWAACQRNVQERTLRARVCPVCITAGRDDAWLLELAKAKEDPAARSALLSARRDQDWRVRWGALRSLAQAQGLAAPQVLADWVMEASGPDALPACLTAARAAAAAGSSTDAFLKDAGAQGPAAAARVWSRRDAIRQVLEVEAYAEAVPVRGEALLHLSVFLGQSPARTLLTAMGRRPESVDDTAAGALLWVADKQGSSVGRMLLEEARSEDQALINRLFAIYSRQLEELHKGLGAVDPLERRGAVQSLRHYGPLARRELERALGDSDLAVRRMAARCLAEAEGLSLPEAANQRILAPETERATRRAWMEAGAVGQGCERFLLTLARETRLDVESRGEAVAWLVECDEGMKGRFEALSPFLKDAAVPVRAGAVRALARLGTPQGDAALAAALADGTPEVVAAALDVVGQRHQRAQAESVVALLDSASPQVREAAARALEPLGRSQDIKPLARVLREDSVVAVRVAAAESLGALGGPLAASALSQALQDPDTHVQHVARRGLVRLGFGP
jgi:HEAT repeat protein